MTCTHLYSFDVYCDIIVFGVLPWYIMGVVPLSICNDVCCVRFRNASYSSWLVTHILALVHVVAHLSSVIAFTNVTTNERSKRQSLSSAIDK
jgi:uncharacterized membrane protein